MSGSNCGLHRNSIERILENLANQEILLDSVERNFLYLAKASAAAERDPDIASRTVETVVSDLGELVGQRLLSDLGRAVVGYHLESLFDRQDRQSGSVKWDSIISSGAGHPRLTVATREPDTELPSAKSLFEESNSILASERQPVFPRNGAQQSPEQEPPHEPEDLLDYSFTPTWFRESSSGEVLEDPFVLDEMPNHLTPFQAWGPLDRSMGHRVIAGSSISSPYVLDIPGPKRGASFRYILTDESVELAHDLCAGRISARNLSDRWFQTFYHIGLFDSDPPDNHEARRALAERDYVCIPGLIRPAVVGALRMHYRRLIRNGRMTFGDSQCPQRWGRHNEPAARIIQRRLTGLVAEIVGKPVKPAYTYTAIYAGGAALLPHTDREQCEYTITVPFEMAPEPTSQCPWPIQLANVNEETSQVYQCLGEGLLFRGRRVIHSREPLPSNSVYGALLLHYVDADFCGPLE